MVRAHEPPIWQQARDAPSRETTCWTWQSKGGVPVAFAQDSLERALSLVDAPSAMAKNHPIRQSSLRIITSAVEGNRERLH